MASQSRTAQEKLTELEKESAPFEDQLTEAAKFVGVGLKDIGRRKNESNDSENGCAAVPLHGREEWLLRWLLKKLQSPKDDIPRRTPDSWRLFCHVIQTVPLANTARTLNERKFMTILRQTLEDAQKAVDALVSAGRPENVSDSSTTIQEEKPKVSKKRKRSGELVTNKKESSNDGAQGLLHCIFTAIDCMVRSTNPISATSDVGRSATFHTEYMKSVIRTSAEESAQILGTWLSLCSTVFKGIERQDSPELQLWLHPFIEVWKSHAVGAEDTIQFSLHCTRPLLSLLHTAKRAQHPPVTWIAELEQLLARNVIIPANMGNNAATGATNTSSDNGDLDILRTLTRVPILLDPANAPVLFDVAIRSLQPHGARRRRSQDEVWLRQVFNTLVEPIPSERSQAHTEALCAMLQSAIDHKVNLELSILRSIASTPKFSGVTEHGDWKLLATIIHLDANVFLIPNEEKDLLQMILAQITAASLGSAWPGLRDLVVNEVLIPLMNEFAKARDLTGFVKHWYAQLVASEKSRAGKELELFSAWEEDTIQTELSKLFEASLTLQQITQILDWLESEVKEKPAAVSVILEAIAVSITREEVVDAVGLRLYQIMFSDGKVVEGIDERYKWRCWRIITRTLQWANDTSIEEVSALWMEKALPFSKLVESGVNSAESLFTKAARGKKRRNLGPSELEVLEQFRCACAFWSIARSTKEFRKTVKPMMLCFIRGYLQGLKSFTAALRRGALEDDSQERVVENTYCTSPNTLFRDDGWMNWSCAQCVIIEFKTVFDLYSELTEDQLKDILQNIFWLASSVTGDDGSRAHGFPKVWEFLLRDESILLNPKIISSLISVMLDEKTHEKGSSLIQYNNSNLFAAQSLLKLPLELITRKDRESIMTKWLPNDVSRNIDKGSLVGSDPAFLALLVKTMQRSPIYENMKFHDLVDVAKAVGDSSKPRVALALFQEVARLTLSHLTASIELAAQNTTYIQDAFKYVQASVGEEGIWVSKTKSAHKDYPAIKLAEVVVGVLSAKSEVLDDSSIISTKDFVKMTKAFKKVLLGRFKKQLRSASNVKSDDDDEALELLCTINAMRVTGVDETKLAKLSSEASFATACIESLEGGLVIGKRLEAFMTTHSPKFLDKALGGELEGDTLSAFGREVIRERIAALTGNLNQNERLKLLQGLIGDDWSSLKQLDKLLAMRHVITTCEDSRAIVDESNKSEAQAFSLSTAYSALCSQLYKATSVRQFSLISETLEMMLHTKGRALSQWNIDSTVGSISILCSRSAPALNPKCAGTIYLHLCALLRAVLTSHRLKLQGHFHLVVQVMQALLRLLFTPHLHTSQAFLKSHPPPAWLPQQSSSKTIITQQHPLASIHATAFTRLLTLICDPTISSVTRSTKNNSLTSATHSAKKIAGQHMHFLLTFYIRLQLEMRMLPEVREKMVPGIYAVFDTTSPEMRRMMSDGLDSSARAVFTGLFRDWQKFGQWKGS